MCKYTTASHNNGNVHPNLTFKIVERFCLAACEVSGCASALASRALTSRSAPAAMNLSAFSLEVSLDLRAITIRRRTNKYYKERSRSKEIKAQLRAEWAVFSGRRRAISPHNFTCHILPKLKPLHVVKIVLAG